MQPSKIRVISICVFRRGNSILVFEGFDIARKTHYYRPLGGGIEPGERAVDAVRREIREEVQLESDGFELLGILENIFELDGKPRHEIVFVFDGRLVDESVYGTTLTVRDIGAPPTTACWRDLNSFDESHRLTPEGLISLLRPRRK